MGQGSAHVLPFRPLSSLWEWAFISSPGAGNSGTERSREGAPGHAAPKGQNPGCVTQKPRFMTLFPHSLRVIIVVILGQ